MVLIWCLRNGVPSLKKAVETRRRKSVCYVTMSIPAVQIDADRIREHFEIMSGSHFKQGVQAWSAMDGTVQRSGWGVEASRTKSSVGDKLVIDE